MSIKHHTQSIAAPTIYALLASVTIVASLFSAFFMFEPTLGHAVLSDEFRIRQTITDETGFLTQPSNISMAGSIAGVSGGQATGTTKFVVRSNNETGYTVTIDFEDNGSDEAMIGDVSASSPILDYVAATMFPTYDFTASTAAQFAYTVTSSTTGDTADAFLSAGSACNSGGGIETIRCWMAPSTTPYMIVDTNAPANNGATSTITFSVVVPSGSNPAITADTYTATATLSLVIQ